MSATVEDQKLELRGWLLEDVLKECELLKAQGKYNISIDQLFDIMRAKYPEQSLGVARTPKPSCSERDV